MTGCRRWRNFGRLCVSFDWEGSLAPSWHCAPPSGGEGGVDAAGEPWERRACTVQEEPGEEDCLSSPAFCREESRGPGCVCESFRWRPNVGTAAAGAGEIPVEAGGAVAAVEPRPGGGGELESD